LTCSIGSGIVRKNKDIRLTVALISDKLEEGISMRRRDQEVQK